MITNYQILADSSCDLPFSLARSLGVSYAPLRVQFQGAEYENFLDGDPRESSGHQGVLQRTQNRHAYQHHSR